MGGIATRVGDAPGQPVQVKDVAHGGPKLTQPHAGGGSPETGSSRRSSSRWIQESWSRVSSLWRQAWTRLAGLGDLGVGFEQQAAHAALGQAALEVEEGAVLLALMAGTLGASASQEPFQERGVDEVRGQREGAQEVGLALAQGQGGEALPFALTTRIYL